MHFVQIYALYKLFIMITFYVSRQKLKEEHYTDFRVKGWMI